MRAILTYHSIDSSGSPISVDAAAFEDHVRWLASGAVRVVPLTEITAVGEREQAVALTFDDAYENFATEAWPRLRDAGLPATVFVVSGRVGTDNRWGGRSEPGIPDMPLLDWDGLGRVAEEGASLGGHGVTHVSLPRCGDAALDDEVSSCSAVIAERAGVRPTTFCYPYGDHDDRVVAKTRQLFDLACTVDLRALGGVDDPWRLPRLDAFYLRNTGKLQSYGTAGFARRVACRSALRSVRSRMRQLLHRRRV